MWAHMATIRLYLANPWLQDPFGHCMSLMDDKVKEDSCGHEMVVISSMSDFIPISLTAALSRLVRGVFSSRWHSWGCKCCRNTLHQSNLAIIEISLPSFWLSMCSWFLFLILCNKSFSERTCWHIIVGKSQDLHHWFYIWGYWYCVCWLSQTIMASEEKENVFLCRSQYIYCNFCKNCYIYNLEGLITRLQWSFSSLWLLKNVGAHKEFHRNSCCL